MCESFFVVGRVICFLVNFVRVLLLFLSVSCDCFAKFCCLCSGFADFCMVLCKSICAI